GAAESVWGAEPPGAYVRGCFDRADPELEIVAHIARRLEVQLPMVVAVIADGVALGRHPADELGPALSVSAQHEEGGADAALGERVEDGRRRVGVRAVVEGEGHNATRPRHVGQRAAEKCAIAMKRAVHGAANHDDAECRAKDHTPTATRPSTLW